MATPSRLEVEARSYEIDPYGHLNNAVYVNWLEHARLVYLRDRGLSYLSVPERFGVHVVVVGQTIAYRAQVRLGDRLAVETRVVRLGRSSFTFAHEMRAPDGRVVCEAEFTMACLGPEGRAVPTPAELRGLLER